MSNKPHTQSDLISVGVIFAAHGIKGNVKIRTFTAHPDDLFSFSKLYTATGQEFAVKKVGSGSDFVIASVKGITDRNAAETLKKHEIFIHRDELPAPNEDEFYHIDLVGCEVFMDSQYLGVVSEVHNFGAGDIIEVRSAEGHEEMFPFKDEFLESVDVNSRKIVLKQHEKL